MSKSRMVQKIVTQTGREGYALGGSIRQCYDPAEAKLFVAAPELLAALEAIAHQLTVGEASDGDARDIAWCAETARVAIAKAKA